jgi:hypothetical protein
MRAPNYEIMKDEPHFSYSYMYLASSLSIPLLKKISQYKSKHLVRSISTTETISKQTIVASFGVLFGRNVINT